MPDAATERIKELLKVARQIERAVARLKVLQAHKQEILKSLDEKEA